MLKVPTKIPTKRKVSLFWGLGTVLALELLNGLPLPGAVQHAQQSPSCVLACVLIARKLRRNSFKNLLSRHGLSLEKTLFKRCETMRGNVRTNSALSLLA